MTKKITKKIKRGIAITLSVAMVLTTTQTDVKASENNTNSCSETVYVDGEKFIVTTDIEDGTVSVYSADKSEDSSLVISENGEAEVTVYDDESNEYEECSLDVEDLSEDNIDIDVMDEDGEIIEEIDDYDDLVDDSYEGQAATVAVLTVISVDTLITALLASAACIAVAGVVYYAGKAVAKEIEKDKQKQKYYYKAYIYNKNVFVNLANKISRDSAVSRIRCGANVYTYTRSLAKSVTLAAGLGATSPEISCFSGKKVKFYHFHTANRNGAHIFYGLPVIS